MSARRPPAAPTAPPPAAPGDGYGAILTMEGNAMAARVTKVAQLENSLAGEKDPTLRPITSDLIAEGWREVSEVAAMLSKLAQLRARRTKR